jgi:hypothetical protein
MVKVEMAALSMMMVSMMDMLLLEVHFLRR